MQEENNKTYIGKIISFKGQFGFIKSELGETFFHKSSIENDFYPQKNDEIEFQIEPSQKKQGKMQACAVALIKKGEYNEIYEGTDNRLIGIVKWFEVGKGFGIVGTPEGVDYFLRKDDLQSKFISAGNVVVFYGKTKNGKNNAIKCKHTFGYKDWQLAFAYANKSDTVKVEFVREKQKDWGYGTYKYTEEQNVSVINSTLDRLLRQKESLSDKEFCLLSLDLLQTKYSNQGYELIKEIIRSNKINEDDKTAFVQSVFNKTSVEYQYKMLFDGLIILSNEGQLEILQKYLTAFENINYSQIISIAKSDKFCKIAKEAFVKSAFNKANAEIKYKILFLDSLIDIAKELPEIQNELLLKYLFELGEIKQESNWNISNRDWKYEKIKSISQSNNIDEKTRENFLKSVFEKASVEYQYKMLFDGLIILSNDSQIVFLQKYLSAFEDINYSQIISVAKSDKFCKIAKEAFVKSAFDKANAEIKYKILFEDSLIDIAKELPEIQNELLLKYLFELGEIKQESNWNISNRDWKYEKIKSISQFDNIDEKTRENFLKSVFEKASVEYQYKMLFEDCLIDIGNESIEIQKGLLQTFKTLNIDQIKTIQQSNKINESIKVDFLKSAFEKANAEIKYEILFEDCLIDIENETTERQIEYLNKIGKINLIQIKSILDSEKINKFAKIEFLNSAFENTSSDNQYEMLFKDHLTNDLSKKLTFLLNSTQEGRMRFSRGQYGGVTYLEILENNDIAYLFKNGSKISDFYIVNHGYWSYVGGRPNSYSLSKKYEEWREAWLLITEEINEKIRNQSIFCNNNAEDIYKLIVQINEAQELYYIFDIEFYKMEFEENIKIITNKLILDLLPYIDNYKWLACIKQYNNELYNSLFSECYGRISKKDRLYLWLYNLNPNYNYLELVQSAWQLSNDERKLLNKRLKEYAKDERLQKFIDQIPTAELIKGTESTKFYKCKWRNLFYKNGSIQVFLDKITATEDYYWESAREEWNLLTQEYFNNRRMEDIIVVIDNNNEIIEISGLEDIEVKIVIAEVQKQGTSTNRVKVTSSKVAKIIHNVSARNQCINFLAVQETDYNVLDIQELVTDDWGSLRRDMSFLFPIPDGKGNVYFIWESTEFEKSKATHIFKCSVELYEDVESKIKEFIESNLRIRSQLNSVEKEAIDTKRNLYYFRRIDHDKVDYQVWENRMKEFLPFLK